MERNEHPPTPPPENEFGRFRQFVKNLMAVPRPELQEEIEKEKARKAQVAVNLPPTEPHLP